MQARIILLASEGLGIEETAEHLGIWRKTVRTVSIDEMTGIQALERMSPGLPMRPGKVERCEFEYRRHGTQTLIAAFLDALLSSASPGIRWRIVCDNLNTHLSESVVRVIARHCSIKDDLGKTQGHAHSIRPASCGEGVDAKAHKARAVLKAEIFNPGSPGSAHKVPLS